MTNPVSDASIMQLRLRNCCFIELAVAWAGGLGARGLNKPFIKMMATYSPLTEIPNKLAPSQPGLRLNIARAFRESHSQ
jgi:hypothetical protein